MAFGKIGISRKKDFSGFGKQTLGLRGCRVLVKKNERGTGRLAFAVSRKYGPAVTRNRLKRIVRSAFMNSSAVESSFDFLVLSPRVDLKYTDFLESFNKFASNRLDSNKFAGPENLGRANISLKKYQNEYQSGKQ